MTAKKKTGDDNSVAVTVFVPSGHVREGDIKRAALLAARDKIPVAAFDVKLTVDKVSDTKTSEGREGRDYTVKITYTPRRTSDPEGDEEAVTVDKVMASLEPLTAEKIAQVTGSGTPEA